MVEESLIMSKQCHTYGVFVPKGNGNEVLVDYRYDKIAEYIADRLNAVYTEDGIYCRPTEESGLLHKRYAYIPLTDEFTREMILRYCCLETGQIIRGTYERLVQSIHREITKHGITKWEKRDNILVLKKWILQHNDG